MLFQHHLSRGVSSFLVQIYFPRIYTKQSFFKVTPLAQETLIGPDFFVIFNINFIRASMVVSNGFSIFVLTDKQGAMECAHTARGAARPPLCRRRRRFPATPTRQPSRDDYKNKPRFYVFFRDSDSTSIRVYYYRLPSE